jgi:hypothetical protein
MVTALVVLVAALLCLSPEAAGDTISSGRIDTTNNHWGTGGNVASPVVLMETVRWDDLELEVTIEPGTEVLFTSPMRLQATNMRAVGTVEQPIVFRPVVPYAGLENGLTLVVALQTTFRFCKFYHACLELNEYGDTVVIEHCLFDSAFHGVIMVYASAPRIVNNTICPKPNGDAIWFNACPVPPVVKNNILAACKYGMWCQGTVATDSIRYNIVQPYDSAFPACPVDSTNIVADVGFVNMGESDFHLLPTSAAVDAGDPSYDFSGEPLCGGENGGVNMGYYGNTPEATCRQGGHILEPLVGRATAPAWTGSGVVFDAAGRLAGVCLTGVAGLQLVRDCSQGLRTLVVVQPR